MQKTLQELKCEIDICFSGLQNYKFLHEYLVDSLFPLI